jgi:hypothetical protein
VRIYAKTPGAKTLEKTLASFARGRGESSYVEAEGLDVGVGGDALLLRRRLHLLNPHGRRRFLRALCFSRRTNVSGVQRGEK